MQTIPRLHLVTDRALAGEKSLVDLVGLAIRGGVDCIQLREKTSSTDEIITLAMALKNLLSPKNIPLLINDYVDVALAINADGVHLGQNDMSVIKARELLGPDKTIGFSVQTKEHILIANKLPIQYFGIGPVFATHTKPDAASPLGIAGLKQLRQYTQLPLIAIGGIIHENIANVLHAGADGVAVVSAICLTNNPLLAAASLSQFITKI